LEIPVFSIADRLLRRYGSSRLLLRAMVCYIVRVLGYSCIPRGHVRYALVLEPLHGVTYAASQTAVVDWVAQRMPHGYDATGQGFIYMFRGGGAIVGLLLGGWVQDTWGARWLYRMAAVVVTMGCGALAHALRKARPCDEAVEPDEMEMTRKARPCDDAVEPDEIQITTASSME
jgi:MFS family permease